MWTVLKFDKKNLALLKEDLTKKLGKDFKIYIPKLRIQKYKNNKNFLKRTNVPSIFNLKSFSRNSSINTSTMILRRNIIKKVKFRNIQKHEDYIFKCEVFKKNKNLFAKKFNKTHAYYRILKNSRSIVSLLNNLFSRFRFLV